MEKENHRNHQEEELEDISTKPLEDDEKHPRYLRVVETPIQEQG